MRHVQTKKAQTAPGANGLKNINIDKDTFSKGIYLVVAVTLLYAGYVVFGSSSSSSSHRVGVSSRSSAVHNNDAAEASVKYIQKPDEFAKYYDGSIAVDHGVSRGYLVVRTIGEVGNHMECLLTAVVGAAMLNLTLVEPKIFPVYHQKHLDLSENYIDPWSDVDTSTATEYSLSRMFQETPYKALEKLPRENYGAKIVGDLPDGLEKMTLGIPEHTWEMNLKNGEKLNATVAAWLKKMEENENRHASKIKDFLKDAKASGDKAPTYPLYYETGTSLCFYALNPKFQETCENMRCQHIVRALQPSDVVKQMADKVLEHIAKQLSEKQRPKWFALHFVHPNCKPGEGVYSENLGKFLDKYVDNVHPSGRNTLYLMSEDRTNKFHVALYRYHFDVITIEDVFPGAYEKFPYNVLQQVDFEVALRSDWYFGHSFSALDQWIAHRKSMTPDNGRDGHGRAVFYGASKACGTDWS